MDKKITLRESICLRLQSLNALKSRSQYVSTLSRPFHTAPNCRSSKPFIKIDQKNDEQLEPLFVELK